MGRPTHSPIWPFLLVVSFLFLLCVLAPREWEQQARQRLSRATADSAVNLADYAPQPKSDAAADDVSSNREPTLAPPRESVQNALSSAVADQNEMRPEAIETQTVEHQPSALAADDSPTARQNVAEAGPSIALPISAANPRELVSDEPAAAPSPSRDETERRDEPDEPFVATAEESSRATGPIETTSKPRWPQPTDLVRRLEALGCECECTDWALQAAQLVVELSQTSPTDERAVAILAELRSLAGAVDSLVPNIGERSVAIELLRARHALTRRLDVWEMIPALLGQETPAAPVGQSEIEKLTTALDDLDAITRQAGAEGQQWRRYLALDELRSLTRAHSGEALEAAQQLARDVRDRLQRTDLNEGQRQFINGGTVRALAAALRPWAFDKFDPLRLLTDIERFEATSQPSDSERLATDCLSLTAGGGGDELTHRLETNYRNANLRLVLSEKLLKRVLPAASTTVDPVSDQVLGLPTRGTSTTSTVVGVKLLPSDDKLRVALEANGQVKSDTRSTSGPATIYTHSDSKFYARKVVDLDLRGIRTEPAESDCLDTRTSLRSVSTDFDGVPLVGALVENFARSRHAEKESAVRSVVRQKVEAQARRKMDKLTEERIDNANRQLQERLMAPLERLSLAPEVISAETSEQRLTLRLRLAADEQLAGYTPRPRAPADNLLSLQIHQSVLNNVCEKLALNGRTFTLAELRAHIVAAFNLKNSPFMDSADKDVTITFASADALRVRCEDGRIELSLAVARLVNAEHSWKDFLVRVYYRPEIEGLQARLVRDGSVQLAGNRISTRSQVALRGIFSKAFAKDRDLILVDSKWSTDERTRDLAFSQFVIQDGWIAVAVSEPQQNVARQPQKLVPQPVAPR